MKFFKKTAIGLEIADRTIEVVELTSDSGGVKILNKNRKLFGAGIVERGRIQNKEKLSLIVKKVFEEAKIQADDVIFGLPESLVYIHTFSLPLSDDKRLGKLILSEMEQTIPLDKDNTVFSYKILEKNKDKIEILLVAADKNEVLNWQKFFSEMGVEVEFDIETLAVFRGLMSDIKKDQAIAVVDIGSMATNIAIFNNIGLRYSSSLGIAGVKFTKDISESLGKSIEEAEELKKTIGLSKPGDPISSALIKNIEKIVKEVSSSIEYFKQKHGEDVNEVILAGGSSQLKNLSEYLSTNLGIPVSVGKQTLSKTSIPLAYVEAIGLALKGIDKSWSKKDPSIEVEDLVVEVKKDSGGVEVSSWWDKLRAKKQDDVPLEDEETEDGSSLKIQKIILISIVAFGIIAIPLAYWYKTNKDDEEIREREAKLDAISALEVKDENVIDVVATTTPEIINTVTITDTPTGWLNVRSGAGTEYGKIGKVYPEESYQLLENTGEWYRIKISEDADGWISSQYADED